MDDSKGDEVERAVQFLFDDEIRRERKFKEAYRRIRIIRKLRKVQNIQKSLQVGSLFLSK